jgi:hypothetical protein
LSCRQFSMRLPLPPFTSSKPINTHIPHIHCNLSFIVYSPLFHVQLPFLKQNFKRSKSDAHVFLPNRPQHKRSLKRQNSSLHNKTNQINILPFCPFRKGILFLSTQPTILTILNLLGRCLSSVPLSLGILLTSYLSSALSAN